MHVCPITVEKYASQVSIDKDLLEEGLNLSKKLISKYGNAITFDLLATITHVEAMHGGCSVPIQNSITSGFSQYGEVSCTCYQQISKICQILLLQYN